VQSRVAWTQIFVEINEVRNFALPLQGRHANISFAGTSCRAGCEVNSLCRNIPRESNPKNQSERFVNSGYVSRAPAPHNRTAVCEKAAQCETMSGSVTVASHRHHRRSIMYQKRPGVFMADWWDADGRRHRKQFATSAGAKEHEHRETALAHAERASREMKLAARTSGTKRSRPKTDTGNMEPAKGKLGVMIPGMGAVATTFVAGVEAIRKGLAKPIGSLTQMGTIRLGKRTDGRSPKVKEFVPLAGLDDLVFTGWDIFEDNMYEAASNAGVLDYRLLEQLKPFLSSVKPRAAVFDHNYVKKIDGPNVKKGKTKMDLAEHLRDDIRDFKKTSGASRLITMWCGSTESYIEPTEAHQSVKSFEKALRENDELIAPSMIYAYASLMEGVPFANGAPNLTVDLPVMLELSRKNEAPICGKDFKTGQTLMKTVLAPAFKARLLGLSGWYSTNILGNRDGEVLDDPGSFKTKEESKLGVLEHILQPGLYPELYGNIFHKVRINYYPPRGDNKEGWDNIDIFGWLGYPMQIKVDFLCRDSILAAPIVLDLVLFLDLAKRCPELRGLGIQEWLSFYFKSPMTVPGLYPEHDLFIQLMKLKNTLRHLKGEELITHLGLEYYD
jgi:myo-inositol-1-phosphate synthase